MKFFMHNVAAVCLLAGALTATPAVYAQSAAENQKQWDDTRQSAWSDDFKVVEIPSQVDARPQRAYLYRATEPGRPLIVSLHTWSGDYRQKDPIAQEALKHNYNYIHPDFQGSNRKPDAMGSPKVIANLQEAIEYAVKETGADKQEVHVIGVSGGGLATLIAYTNVTYPVKSFSAWAPISDIEAWYWQSRGRKSKYADHIWAATSSTDKFRAEEARKRSPLYQPIPKKQRRTAQLFIYEGVHDGYTGSVPVTHAINMYNRVVGEMVHGLSTVESANLRSRAYNNLVSQEEVIDLLAARCVPHADPTRTIGDRQVYLEREGGNTKLILFEGTHEMLPCALDLLPIGK